MRKSDRLSDFMLWGIILVALLLRMWLLLTYNEQGLFYDELQSVVFSHSSWSEVIRNVQTFDVHPPLYYLQLHYWMNFGTNDIWLKTNSLLWSLVAVISLYWVTSRFVSQRVGLWAAASLAISPFAISYATTVRMYSPMLALTIWVFWFTHSITLNTNSVRSGIGLVLSELGLLFMHGSGVLILPSSALYAGWAVLDQRDKTRIFSTLIPWALAQSTVILIFILNPLSELASDRAENFDQHSLLHLQDIANTITQLYLGVKISLWQYFDRLSLLILMALVVLSVALIRDRRSRRIIVSFWLLPFIINLAVSYFITLVWLPRVLIGTLPFLAIGTAILVEDSIQNQKVYVTKVGLLSLAFVIPFCGLLYQQQNYLPWWHFKEAVEFVEKHSNPDDIIYIPNPRMFWGWNWYYIGPGSVEPLTTSYLVRLPNGQEIVSNPALSQLDMTKPPQSNRNVWLVYRTIDDPSAIISVLPNHTIQQTFIFSRNVMIQKMSSNPETP